MPGYYPVASSMLPEATIRNSMMRRVLRQLSSRIFRNPDIEMEQRAQVAMSLVVPVGMFQASSWPKLTNEDYRRMSGGYMAIAYAHERPAPLRAQGQKYNQTIKK